MANMMNSAREDAPQLYARAMDFAATVVGGVRPEQWHNATPCADWDMRVLVNHITSENLWVEQILGGKTIAEVGSSLDGDLLGDDPAGAYQDSVARAKASLLPERFDKQYGVSFGNVSGYDYLSQMFMDQLVHTWDVAKGSGRDVVFEEDLVEAAVPIAEEMVTFVGEGDIFGYRQEAPAGTTNLVGVLGRRLDWQPPAGARFV